jgi:amino acid transporter
LILFACIIGGFIGGAVVFKIHPLFAYTDLPEMGLDASAEIVQQHRDAEFEFRSRNYCADLGIIGLILGLSFGAFAGGAHRLRAVFAGGLAGTLLGAGQGFLGGLYVARTTLQNAQQTLHESLGLQAIVWGLVLAGIVWAVAASNVGALSAIQYSFVGLMAGFTVAVTQFVVSSFKFPASNPLFLVPERSSEQIYWLIAFPIVSGLILAFGLRRRGSETIPEERVASVT